MIILTMNDKTGEVKELKMACPFRSLTDLKRDELKDGEDYVEGTSQTSLEGYEPLSSIIARCTRTMVGPGGQTYSVLDKDALKAEETQQGIYEASGANTLDEAFATMDPTDGQGFDLADASQVMSSLNDKTNELTNAETDLSTKRVNDASLKNAKVNDGIVGKSDDAEGTSANKSENDFPEKN